MKSKRKKRSMEFWKPPRKAKNKETDPFNLTHPSNPLHLHLNFSLTYMAIKFLFFCLFFFLFGIFLKVSGVNKGPLSLNFRESNCLKCVEKFQAISYGLFFFFFFQYHTPSSICLSYHIFILGVSIIVISYNV